MSKIIFWIVVFFAILLILKFVNASKAKSRQDEQARRERRTIPPAEPTVRCVQCGVFVPKSESMPVATGFRCRPDCGQR